MKKIFPVVFFVILFLANGVFSTTISPNSFGFITETRVDPETLFNGMNDIGVELGRHPIRWSFVEAYSPADGAHSYDFSFYRLGNKISYDELFKQHYAHGIELIAIVGFPPEWAARKNGCNFDLSNHLQDFKEFVKAAAERYDGDCDWDGDGSCNSHNLYYCPKKTVTRGEMCVFFARALDLPVTSCVSPPFSDVSVSHPFCGYIAACKDAGIVGGYPDGTFLPDEPALREQQAVFIKKAFNLQASNNSTQTFKDVPKNYWANEYIETVYAENIISECHADIEDGTSMPLIRYWEIDNEENNCWSGNATGWANMLKESYLAIKSIQPNATVVMGGLGYPWGDEYMCCGIIDGYTFADTVLDTACNYTDAIVIHPFAFLATASSSKAYSPEQRGLSANLDSFSNLFLSHCGKTKLWITEFGYGTSNETNCKNSPPPSYQNPYVSEEQQANWFVRAMTIAFSKNYFEKFVGVALQDLTNFWDFWECTGLKRANGSKKPAYDAVKTFFNQLNGASFSSALSLDANNFGYEFVNGNKKILVLWNSSGSSSVTINIGASNAKKITRNGSQTSVTTNNGQITLTLTESPIYLVYGCSSGGKNLEGFCDASCGASQWCNGLLPGTEIGYCAKGGNTAIHDKCNSSCQVVDRPDNICRKTGVSDCTGAIQCDLVAAGTCITATTGCTSGCAFIDCSETGQVCSNGNCITTNEICSDDLDNDGDGKIDCQDPDCPPALNCGVCQFVSCSSSTHDWFCANLTSSTSCGTTTCPQNYCSGTGSNTPYTYPATCTNYCDGAGNCLACSCTPTAGDSCGNSGYCSFGECIPCAIGTANCNQAISDGCEANLGSDSVNCGGCGNSCAVNEVCVSGVCVVRTEDCSNGVDDDGDGLVDCEDEECPSGLSCGVCAFEACSSSFDWFCESSPVTETCGTVECPDNYCVGNVPFVYADSCTKHCDGQGNCSDCSCTAIEQPACGNNAFCSSGSCMDCAMGYGNCNLDPVDGCEIDLQIDESNCGSCGNSCAVNEVCVSGTCQTIDLCDSISCGENSSCSNGICSCEIGYSNCDGSWSNGCETFGDCPECEEGITQECTTSSGCSGQQTCIGGTWGDCELSAPACEPNAVETCTPIINETSCNSFTGSKTCNDCGTGFSECSVAETVVCCPGQEETCTLDDYLGVRVCSAEGKWEDCIVDDACYGVTCNDGNPCTEDSCLKGNCVFTQLADCSVSVCGDETCSDDESCSSCAVDCGDCSTNSGGGSSGSGGSGGGGGSSAFKNLVTILPEFAVENQQFQVQVIDGQGRSVIGAKATYAGQQKNTNADGIVIFTALLSETEITIEKAGYTTYVATVDVKPAGFDQNTPRISGDSQLHLEFPEELTVEESFTIQVVDSEGKPLQGVEVSYGGETKYTDSSGEVQFVAREGTINLSAFKSGYNRVIQTVQGGPKQEVCLFGLCNFSIEEYYGLIIALFVALVIAAAGSIYLIKKKPLEEINEGMGQELKEKIVSEDEKRKQELRDIVEKMAKEMEKKKIK